MDLASPDHPLVRAPRHGSSSSDEAQVRRDAGCGQEPKTSEVLSSPRVCLWCSSTLFLAVARVAPPYLHDRCARRPLEELHASTPNHHQRTPHLLPGHLHGTPPILSTSSSPGTPSSRLPQASPLRPMAFQRHPSLCPHLTTCIDSRSWVSTAALTSPNRQSRRCGLQLPP